MNNKTFIEICKKSVSMSVAAKQIGLPFSTFKRKALKLNCYKTNQGLKGTNKPKKSIPIEDILNGKHPNYQSNKLRKRLIKEKIFKDKCNKCGWNKKFKTSKFSSCELHHKDGNSKNHRKENLEILCPNCHSQTDNFRFRKR